jgi:predicted membrane chloride channel (bestrophin family)
VLLGRKRTHLEVAAAADRIRMWRKFWDSMPELQAVAVRLLPAHATNAATERHWSLWGRMYCAARSLLGMQRAKALTAICAAEKAKIDPT